MLNSTYLPVYSAKDYGVVGNGISDDTAALRAAIAAVAHGSGGFLFIPAGVYQVSSQILIPSGVQIVGVGWSVAGIGTTIRANSKFPGSAPFPANMMLAIDGVNDTYGSGASNLAVDCNGVPGCGGLYRGHANEQTYFKRINVLNYTSYGMYICGAGENIDQPHVCNGTSTAGAQGDGPDEDLQFLPGTSSNANTLSIVIRNEGSYRGLNNITINTSSVGGQQPQYAGWLSGAGLKISNVHMEGPANGFILGPSAGLCPKNCHGLIGGDLNNIDLMPRGGGPVLILQQVSHVTMTDIRGLGNVLFSQLRGQNISSNGWVGFAAVDGSGRIMSNDSNLGNASSANLNYMTQQTIVDSSTGPQLVVKNSSAPNSPYYGFTIENDGTMGLYGQGGTGNLSLSTPDAVLAMGSQTPMSGLNLQSPNSGETGGVRDSVCDNAYWDKVNKGWMVHNNGGVGYACEIFPWTGGMAITAQMEPGPGLVSTAQFLAGTSAYFAPNGTQAFGNKSVSGAVTTFTNGYGTCSINPTSASLSCSSDERLKKNIESLPEALPAITSLRPRLFNWAKEPTDEPKHVGLIAQEVEQVLPGLVSTDEKGFKAVGYSALIPYLIEAIKEQQQQIEQLKSQMNAR